MARHHYRCPLRWADMDAFGHVNNVVFLRYLEEARIDFMFRLAPGEGSESFTGGSVVARHEIDYKLPLVHRHEPVLIESWVTRIGAASLTIRYEVKDEATEDAPETVYVRAETVVVPYDLAAGRPRRITAEERRFLEEYLDEPVAASAGASASASSSASASASGARREGRLAA